MRGRADGLILCRHSRYSTFAHGFFFAAAMIAVAYFGSRALRWTKYGLEGNSEFWTAALTSSLLTAGHLFLVGLFGIWLLQSIGKLRIAAYREVASGYWSIRPLVGRSKLIEASRMDSDQCLTLIEARPNPWFTSPLGPAALFRVFIDGAYGFVSPGQDIHSVEKRTFI